MKHLYTIETGSNPSGIPFLSTFHYCMLMTGICSLSSSAENSYLVFPHPNSTSPTFTPTHTPSLPPLQHSGEVLVFDTLGLSPINVIAAHKTPIALLSLSPKGDVVATASDKGTVIRVFSIPSGEKLYQFRRGSYPARITSMAFNFGAEYLAVGSDTETVHIFRCAAQKGAQQQGELSRTWSGTSDSPVASELPDAEDMDRSIEQKRRNGSMGYPFPILTPLTDIHTSLLFLCEKGI